MFEMLLSRGADANATNNAGETIVHKYIEDENAELLNYMISHGIVLSQHTPLFAFEEQEEFNYEEGDAQGDAGDDDANED